MKENNYRKEKRDESNQKFNTRTETNKKRVKRSHPIVSRHDARYPSGLTIGNRQDVGAHARRFVALDLRSNTATHFLPAYYEAYS